MGSLAERCDTPSPFRLAGRISHRVAPGGSAVAEESFVFRPVAMETTEQRQRRLEQAWQEAEDLGDAEDEEEDDDDDAADEVRGGFEGPRSERQWEGHRWHLKRDRTWGHNQWLASQGNEVRASEVAKYTRSKSERVRDVAWPVKHHGEKAFRQLLRGAQVAPSKLASDAATGQAVLAEGALAPAAWTARGGGADLLQASGLATGVSPSKDTLADSASMQGLQKAECEPLTHAAEPAFGKGFEKKALAPGREKGTKCKQRTPKWRHNSGGWDEKQRRSAAKLAEETALLEERFQMEHRRRMLVEQALAAADIDLPDVEEKELSWDLAHLESFVLWLRNELAGARAHLGLLQLRWIDKVRADKENAAQLTEQAEELLTLQKHLVGQVEWTRSNCELEKQVNDELEEVLSNPTVDTATLAEAVSLADAAAEPPPPQGLEATSSWRGLRTAGPGSALLRSGSADLSEKVRREFSLWAADSSSSGRQRSKRGSCSETMSPHSHSSDRSDSPAIEQSPSQGGSDSGKGGGSGGRPYGVKWLAPVRGAVSEMWDAQKAEQAFQSSLQNRPMRGPAERRRREKGKKEGATAGPPQERSNMLMLGLWDKKLRRPSKPKQTQGDASEAVAADQPLEAPLGPVTDYRKKPNELSEELLRCMAVIYTHHAEKAASGGNSLQVRESGRPGMGSPPRTWATTPPMGSSPPGALSKLAAPTEESVPTTCNGVPMGNGHALLASSIRRSSVWSVMAQSPHSAPLPQHGEPWPDDPVSKSSTSAGRKAQPSLWGRSARSSTTNPPKSPPKTPPRASPPKTPMESPVFSPPASPQQVSSGQRSVLSRATDSVQSAGPSKIIGGGLQDQQHQPSQHILPQKVTPPASPDTRDDWNTVAIPPGLKGEQIVSFGSLIRLPRGQRNPGVASPSPPRSSSEGISSTTNWRSDPTFSDIILGDEPDSTRRWLLEPSHDERAEAARVAARPARRRGSLVPLVSLDDSSAARGHSGTTQSPLAENGVGGGGNSPMFASAGSPSSLSGRSSPAVSHAPSDWYDDGGHLDLEEVEAALQDISRLAGGGMASLLGEGRPWITRFPGPASDLRRQMSGASEQKATTTRPRSSIDLQEGEQPSLGVLWAEGLPSKAASISSGYTAQGDGGSYAQMTEVKSVPEMDGLTGVDTIMLSRFRALVRLLEDVQPAKLSHDERVAFWLNIYNAALLHAFLAGGVPSSEMKQLALMSNEAVRIGGHTLSALTIEHCLLRARSFRPAMGTSLVTMRE